MKNQRNRGSTRANLTLVFLTGLLLGGLTGAVVMLLWAPRAGDKTRSRLQKQGAKLRRRAIEGVEDVVAEVSDKTDQFTDSVRHEAGELQKNAQDLMSVGKR